MCSLKNKTPKISQNEDPLFDQTSWRKCREFKKTMRIQVKRAGHPSSAAGPDMDAMEASALYDLADHMVPRPTFP